MIIECLIGLIILILLLSWLQSCKYMKIIASLTDKLMARNYDNYIIGQGLKDNTEVESKQRTDTQEFLIQEARKSGRKLKDVEKEWNKKMQEII